MPEPGSFYQPLFTPSEQRDLDAAPLDAATLLEDQINISRVLLRRMFKLSKQQQPTEQIKTLAILSAVSGRLVSMVRAQQQLKVGSGGDSELKIMIDQVLAEVQSTWTVEE